MTTPRYFADTDPPTGGLNTRPRAPLPAMPAAKADIEAQAAKTAESLIEARSCDYALMPALLDLLEPYRLMLGIKPLSKLSPLRLRFRLDELIVLEMDKPRQLGGEAPLVNLRAAQRYAQRLVEIEDAERPPWRRRKA